LILALKNLKSIININQKVNKNINLPNYLKNKSKFKEKLNEINELKNKNKIKNEITKLQNEIINFQKYINNNIILFFSEKYMNYLKYF